VKGEYGMTVSLKEFKVDEHLAYKVTSIDFCCDSINQCMTIDLETETDFKPHISICQSVEYYADGDSYPTIECTPIKFCPFCGDEINIEIVDKEDLSVIYDTMQMTEMDYRNKSRITNSKKKEQEWLTLAREISDELNYYLSNDTIHTVIL
jgi:hypothetical protein